jgi:hypothetical protein
MEAIFHGDKPRLDLYGIFYHALHEYKNIGEQIKINMIN